jgi:hypothetical protein
MHNDPEAAWTAATPIVRGYIAHHGKFLDDLGTLDQITSPTGGEQAAKAAIMSMNSATASVKKVSNAHLSLRHDLETSERSTYPAQVMGISRAMEDDISAVKYGADAALSELGPEHPLTQKFTHALNEKTAIRSLFHKTWKMQTDVDFEDIMKNSNLNPNQFN